MSAPWLNDLPWTPYEYHGTGADTLTPPDFAAKLDEEERRARKAERAQRARLLDARNGKVPVQPCGTFAAYQRHMRRGEEACGPCREAMRAENRRRRGIPEPLEYGQEAS